MLLCVIFTARRMRRGGTSCRRSAGVSPSVCLSVRNIYYIQMAKISYNFFFRPGSPIFLVVFEFSNAITHFQGEPLSVALSTRGWGKFAIFNLSRPLSRKRYEMGHWQEVIGSRSIRVGSDDLEWPWKARVTFFKRTWFLGQTVWPKTKKLGVVTQAGRGVFLGVSRAPIAKGRNHSVPQFWRFRLFMPLPSDVERPNGFVFRGQPRPRHKRDGAPALPNFGVPLYLRL